MSPPSSTGLALSTPFKPSASSACSNKSRIRWHPIVERGGRPTLFTRRKYPIPLFVEIPPPKLFLSPLNTHFPHPIDDHSAPPTPPPTAPGDKATRELGTESSFGNASSHSGLRLIFDDESIRTLPYRSWTKDHLVECTEGTESTNDKKFEGLDTPPPSPTFPATLSSDDYSTSLTAPPLIPIPPSLAGGAENRVLVTLSRSVEWEEVPFKRRDVRQLPKL